MTTNVAKMVTRNNKGLGVDVSIFPRLQVLYVDTHINKFNLNNRNDPQASILRGART